jgi:hypothetical protein
LEAASGGEYPLSRSIKRQECESGSSFESLNQQEPGDTMDSLQTENLLAWMRHCGQCAFTNWHCEPNHFAGDVAEAWEQEHATWPLRVFATMSDADFAACEQEFRNAWATARDRVQLADERVAS